MYCFWWWKSIYFIWISDICGTMGHDPFCVFSGTPTVKWKSRSRSKKTMKHMMLKTLKDGRDQYEALLELRNTPCQSIGLSLAEMMFGYNTRSNISSVKRSQILFSPNTRYYKKQVIKRCYDKKAKDLPSLNIGQPVYFEHKEGKNSVKGTVLTKHRDRFYIVQSEDGA